MNIRPARIEDASAVAVILNTIIRDTLATFTTDLRSVESIAVEIQARGPAFLVADIGGNVVGYATYGPFRAGPGYAQSREHSVFLSPQARGQGVGRALMNAMEVNARADNVHALVAGISSANPAAVAFHSAIGFTHVGLLPEVGFKWGQRLDLVLMQKILASE